MTPMMLDPPPDVCTASELDRAISDPALDRDLMTRVAAVRSLVCGRIVFTTSFGLEDQAIAHVILAQALEIEVVTLDTGVCFRRPISSGPRRNADTDGEFRRSIPIR